MRSVLEQRVKVYNNVAHYIHLRKVEPSRNNWKITLFGCESLGRARKINSIWYGNIYELKTVRCERISREDGLKSSGYIVAIGYDYNASTLHTPSRLTTIFSYMSSWLSFLCLPSAFDMVASPSLTIFAITTLTRVIIPTVDRHVFLRHVGCHYLAYDLSALFLLFIDWVVYFVTVNLLSLTLDSTYITNKFVRTRIIPTFFRSNYPVVLQERLGFINAGEERCQRRMRGFPNVRSSTAGRKSCCPGLTGFTRDRAAGRMPERFDMVNAWLDGIWNGVVMALMG